MFLRAALIVGVLFVLFYGAILAMRFLRRQNDRRAEEMDFNFSLDELHRLHAEGKLTAEEFERAKSVILIRRAGRVEQPGTQRGFEVLPPGGDKDRPQT